MIGLERLPILIRKSAGFCLHKPVDILWRVVKVFNYYEYDPLANPLDCEPRIAGDFKLFHQLSEIAALKDYLPPSVYRLCEERLTQFNDPFFAFLTGGRPVYWVFLRIGPQTYHEPVLERDIPIPEDAIFLYDGYTKPEFRRCGIYAAKFCKIRPVLEDFKKKRLVFILRPQDKPTMNNAKKFRFRILKKYILLKVGFVKLKLDMNP